MKSHASKVDQAYNDLLEATKSGDKIQIALARETYDRTVRNVTLNSQRFKDMRDETCAKLSNLNETALDYVNGNMPKIYTINYNAVKSDIPIAGYSFSLVNENAVKNLINTGDLSLYKHVNVPKDMAWNEKYINSQITQGIIQGESIPQISKRIFPEIERKVLDTGLISRNLNSSIRVARTMTTAAENKGHQDSYQKAVNDGIILKRVWVATHDERTRAWHSDLDGVEVDIDEPWENDYGEIMFPGDPTADPANVYNCRCRIKAVVKGFNWNYKPLSLEEEGEILSYKSSDYYGINETLRNVGIKALSDAQRAKVAKLDSALNKLPNYEGDLTRSLYFGSDEELKEYIDSIRHEKELYFKQYISTTKGSELYNPEGQVQMYIEDATSGKDLVGYDNGENEVLFKRNSKFKVKKQYWKDGKYIVILREVK